MRLLEIQEDDRRDSYIALDDENEYVAVTAYDSHTDKLAFVDLNPQQAAELSRHLLAWARKHGAE